MLTFLSILGLIVLGVIFFVLGVGIIIIVGVCLLIAAVVAGIAFLFGGLHFDSNFTKTMSQTATDSNDEAITIVQEFNSCLMGDELELCRSKFTHWDEKDKELIKQLSHQVKTELGRRTENHQVSKIERSEVNGNAKVTIDQETDFEKKRSVKEHYSLESDPNDKDKLKIRDLNWDY